MVGYSETLQGVTKVAFSFISGCLADKKKGGGGKEQRAVVRKATFVNCRTLMG